MKKANSPLLDPQVFNQVMGSKDLAPLVLKHLDSQALINYAKTYKLGYQRVNEFHWGKKLLIDQGYLEYFLIEHVVFHEKIGEHLLRNLYLTLRNNRRFAREEFSESSVNYLFQGTFSQRGLSLFPLICLMGRKDILLDYLREHNLMNNTAKPVPVNELITGTKHRATFYLVYGKHFNLIKELIDSKQLQLRDIFETPEREDIYFAGGCAGLIDIEQIVSQLFVYGLKMTLHEKMIVASGLIICNHLTLLKEYLNTQRLDLISILQAQPYCLFGAAENGHLDMVRFILAEITRHNNSNKKHPDRQFLLATCDAKKRTLLHYFAYHGWESDFLELADVPKEKTKIRSLMKKLNRTKAPRTALESLHLSPMQPDIDGEMPLHFALRGGKLSMVKLCQDRGWGDVKTLEVKDGLNAIDVVIQSKQNHLIDPLIDYFKLDITEMNGIGLNPLLSCAHYNNWEAFVKLSPRFKNPLSHRTPSGRTLAHIAVSNADIPFLRQLKTYCLKQGPSCFNNLFRSCDNDGNTLLHKLCASTQFYIGTFTLIFEEFDCDLYLENKFRENPIHTLLQTIHLRPSRWDIVVTIVEKYDKENRLLQSTNRDGKSLLELARAQGKESLFEKASTHTL